MIGRSRWCPSPKGAVFVEAPRNKSTALRGHAVAKGRLDGIFRHSGS
jgi:hypothetical protein